MGGGGWLCQNKKCWGVMPKYVMDLKKCWGVENVWGVEKCLGGMPTNFVYGFGKKKIFLGGGVWLCPNILLT